MDILNSWLCGPLQHGSLLHQSMPANKAKESASKIEISTLCNPMTEVISYHFCYILSVTSESVDTAHSQVEGVTQRHKYHETCIIKGHLRNRQLPIMGAKSERGMVPIVIFG
jgi:hypothetical protein